MRTYIILGVVIIVSIIGVHHFGKKVRIAEKAKIEQQIKDSLSHDSLVKEIALKRFESHKLKNPIYINPQKFAKDNNKMMVKHGKDILMYDKEEYEALDTIRITFYSNQGKPCEFHQTKGYSNAGGTISFYNLKGEEITWRGQWKATILTKIK